MTLSAKCIERLTILADYIDGLPNDGQHKLNMGLFIHPFGTICCAAGWATHVPAFIAEGLGVETFCGSEIPSYGNESGFMALKTFFNTEMNTIWALFSPSLRTSIHTPQQWAAHCRAFLKEHGAQVVVPTSDKFTAFMGRVLAPVEVEA